MSPPQEKKAKVLTAAKTLAKLVSAKNRAHKKLVKASSPEFSQETRALLNWKNPTGGSHALLKQNFKMSQLCQPLQLPFQLLWPPDPINQPPAASQFQIVAQRQPPLVDKSQPLHAEKQPRNVAKCSSQLPNQPEASQPLNIGIKQPPADQSQSPAANQPQNCQPLDRRKSQPLKKASNSASNCGKNSKQSYQASKYGWKSASKPTSICSASRPATRSRSRPRDTNQHLQPKGYW